MTSAAPADASVCGRGFAFAVQDVLQVFTQVVTVAGLKARMRERVLAESLPI
jgi:hypothetical protein